MPSEVLRTVRRTRRAEEIGRALQRAGLQLANALRSSELVEVEGAEVGGRKVGRVELELGFVIRPLHRLADAPAPRVPGAERISHVDDDCIVPDVGAPGECRLEIDEAEPETLE